MPTHVAITYEDVHKTIRASAEKIRKEFNPDMLIAIGAPPVRSAAVGR
jgi:hypoxanthine phosphoribosyltransferase